MSGSVSEWADETAEGPASADEAGRGWSTGRMAELGRGLRSAGLRSAWPRAPDGPSRKREELRSARHRKRPRKKKKKSEVSESAAGEPSGCRGHPAQRASSPAVCLACCARPPAARAPACQSARCACLCAAAASVREPLPATACQPAARVPARFPAGCPLPESTRAPLAVRLPSASVCVCVVRPTASFLSISSRP